MYLGIDLGGTKLMLLLGTVEGEVISERSVATPSRHGIEQVIATICTLASNVLRDAKISPKDISGVGLAVAGAVDSNRGVIIDSPHLRRITNHPMANMLQNAINIPVSIGNDANLAALAEHRLGAGRGIRDMVFITISTGIGAGIIINNRLFTGSDGFGGEIGHMTVDANGPYGKSRTPGAMESLASGSAIARIAREHISNGKVSTITHHVRNRMKNRITAESVFTAFHQGDPLAEQIISEATHYLGIGLTSIVNILNPSAMIIGGGLSNEWDSYIRPAVRLMRKNSFGGMGKTIKVRHPQLGSRSGAIGAILQVSEMLSPSPLPSF
jgi:glucokinase